MLIMYRDPEQRSNQQGFTLVWALFLIVIGALISIFMMRMSAVQGATNDLAMNGARAWQAAHAGSEWGIQRAVAGICPGSTGFTLSDLDLNGFNVTVTCSSTAHSESGNVVVLYKIASSASRGAYGTSSDYVYRQVQVTVAQ